MVFLNRPFSLECDGNTCEGKFDKGSSIRISAGVEKRGIFKKWELVSGDLDDDFNFYVNDQDDITLNEDVTLKLYFETEETTPTPTPPRVQSCGNTLEVSHIRRAYIEDKSRSIVLVVELADPDSGRPCTSPYTFEDSELYEIDTGGNIYATGNDYVNAYDIRFNGGQIGKRTIGKRFLKCDSYGDSEFRFIVFDLNGNSKESEQLGSVSCR